jgi:transcriptional regulator, Spx/MgsR family|nr:transcriptional regulator [Bacillota bacterium]
MPRLSEITLYHYPKCTTSRKARQFLDQLGVEVRERRYFTEPATEEEIRDLARRLPGGVRDLVAERSRRFKELNLAGRELSDEEWVRLLAREPGLWRRPIAVKGQRVVVGYDEEALRALAERED